MINSPPGSITILNLHASNNIVSKYIGEKKADTVRRKKNRWICNHNRILLRADEQAENHQSGFKACAISI